MFQVLVICILSHICDEVMSQQAVDPPIMRIGNGGNVMNMKYSVSIRKYSQVIQPLVPATPSDDKTTTTTKRDVTEDIIDGITTLSTYEQNSLEPEEESTARSCAFSFTLPNPLPTNQQVCVTEVGDMKMPSSDDYREYDSTAELNEIRDQVSSLQETVLELESKFTEHVSDTDLEPVKTDIRLLQKESRNMNSRLSQLYIQFLNEIIQTRDDTIEFTRLENDVLNITVKYHELKDRHGELVLSHGILKLKTDAQQAEIDYLQQRVEDMTEKMNEAALKAEEAVAWCKQIASTRRSGNDEEVAANITLPPLIQVKFRDCTEVQRAGFGPSGKYDLWIPSLGRSVKAWCDFDQDPGGWTVIQRRSVGRTNFYRNMASYTKGFGSIESDFWLGLDIIHHLTSQTDKNYKLHIDMEDWNGVSTFVEYGSFKIGTQEDGYRLRVAHYSGTAGDSLTWHNNMKFSTKNVDNDEFKKNCAHSYKGGWWYRTCAHSNLNGIYHKTGLYTNALHSAQDGIFWSEWKGESYSLKTVEMKVMPNE